jgi:hypothetical protein
MRSVLIEHVEKVMVAGRCPRGRPPVMLAQGEVLRHACSGEQSRSSG